MARTRSRSGGRGAGRTAVLVLAVLVALASTAAVVLAEDPQVLRLAVVGALWAFVLGAWAGPRRREDPAGPDAEELRRAYEAELQKEVAARREYELQLEVALRRELEHGVAEDVAALRDEVHRLTLLVQAPPPAPARPVWEQRYDLPTDAVPVAPRPVAPLPLAPPAPRAPLGGESVPRRRPPAPDDTDGGGRRRRARDDGEANEVMSRLLGR